MPACKGTDIWEGLLGKPRPGKEKIRENSINMRKGRESKRWAGETTQTVVLACHKPASINIGDPRKQGDRKIKTYPVLQGPWRPRSCLNKTAR